MKRILALAAMLPLVVSAGPTLRSMESLESLDGGFGEPTVAQFNSNYPEVLTRLEGAFSLAASTLSPHGKDHPETHLDYAFEGDFRIFSSHQNRTPNPLYESLILFNPSRKSASLRVKALASLSTRQAGYAPAPGPGPDGPGEAVSRAILDSQGQSPQLVQVHSGQALVLSQQIHPCGSERMTQAELFSDQPIQVALLYHRDPLDPMELQRALRQAPPLPTHSEHDRVPSPPRTPTPIVYGRVAGVVSHSEFVGGFSNTADHSLYLVRPEQRQRFALNSTRNRPRSDGLDDAAPLIRRLPGSAYASHGNYGAHFRLRGNLYNDSNRRLKTKLSVESQGPFRQSFRVTAGEKEPQLVRVLAPKGTADSLLTEVTLEPGQRCELRLEFFYAANNQPPQTLVLTTGPAGSLEGQ